MSTRPLASLCRKALYAAGLVLAMPLSPTAADNAPPEALHVKILPDRYVAAGKSFVDVAALETWAKPILIRTLWLDNCNPASTKLLLDAVERFHSVYSNGIQIRALSPGEAGCISVAINESPVLAHSRTMRADAEYLVVDEFGRSNMP